MKTDGLDFSMTNYDKIEHTVRTALALGDPLRFTYDEFGQLTFTQDSTVYYIDVVATEVV